MIRKIIQGLILLLVAGGMLFMSGLAYFLYYTTGELPMMHVRRGGTQSAAFYVTLVTYAVFFLIGLTSLRFFLSDYLGKEAAARHFDRLALRYILPVFLAVGVIAPLVIGR